METAQQTKAEAPATRPRSAVAAPPATATAPRQSYQPVYVEPRGTAYEGEARRAARRFGESPVDFSPSAYAASPQRSELGPDLSHRLVNRLGGGGRALTGETRMQMERHFYRKLGGIRIDDGPVAQEVGTIIDAPAFTLRRHIFFRDGFTASDPADIRTLAHELTHVLQQSGGGADAYVIQREDPGATEVSEKWEGSGKDKGFSLDFETAPSLFTMPRLVLPKVNGKIKGMTPRPGITLQELITRDFSYTTRNKDRKTIQRQIWTAEVLANKKKIEAAIATFLPNPASGNDPDPVYYLKVVADEQLLAGTKSQLLARPELTIPTWDNRGKASFFDADHYREYQLEGPDVIANVWLLRDSANRSAGSTIRNTVLAQVNDLFARARATNFFVGRNKSRDDGSSRRTPRNQKLRFVEVVGGGELKDAATWTIDEIIAAKHIKYDDRLLIKAVPLKELRDLGRVAGAKGQAPTKVAWFLGPDTGRFRRVDVADPASPVYGKAPLAGQKDTLINNFVITSAALQDGLDPSTLAQDDQIGSITGKVEGGVGTFYNRKTHEKVKDKRIKVPADITLPLCYDRRYGYGAYIDRQGVRKALMDKRAELAGMSPIALDQAGLGDDWAMGLSGTFTSDHPMFKGFQATVGLTAAGIALDVAIPTDKLDFGFFKVTEANLALAYGDAGLLFAGSAAFELKEIGRGTILARGTDLEGTFDFDFDFVDPASIKVRYADESWSFDASLGIKEGVVPGLQSGTILVGVSEEGGFVFDGTAMVRLPGQSEPVSITVGYSETEGLTFGGQVTLDTSNWPAVRDATVSVLARYNAEEDAWALSGTGSARFALPGVTGTLTASYADGGLILRGNGALAIANATGTFAFALGNYPVTEQGEFDQAAGPTDDFSAWGGGSVSIKFGPYITGTVGVTYTPENKIDLMGEVALPPSIPLFRPLPYKKTLIEFPKLEFPIFGISIPVVGSIGVFGFIGGEVRGYATIGPASIGGSLVHVDYTLGEPDSAHLHGQSHLNFRMDAGIEVDVGGGLGFDALIGRLTGEVGITAALDLPVEAGADLDIDWTPQQGLSLDLGLQAALRTTFRVGVYGKVSVRVRFYGEVWGERWDETLASFGSGLEVSIKQPAHWDEENGLDLDFDKAEFTYPRIDIKDLASGIMDKVI
jgi:hypothetical protein